MNIYDGGVSRLWSIRAGSTRDESRVVRVGYSSSDT